MKVIILGLAGLAVLLLAGWRTTSGQATPSTERQREPEQADTIKKIAGRWHAFPTGLLIQFEEDGSAQFGLDWDGTPIGYEAKTWFEGGDLAVRFTDYDGQNVACAAATGRYTAQLHEDGNISFNPIHDDCQFRMEILDGPPEADSALMYHPVQK